MYLSYKAIKYCTTPLKSSDPYGPVICGYVYTLGDANKCHLNKLTVIVCLPCSFFSTQTDSMYLMAMCAKLSAHPMTAAVTK